MKTALRSFVIIGFVLFAAGQQAWAQAKLFRGVVTQTRTYGGEVDAATLAQLPKLSTTYIMDNKKKDHVDFGGAAIDVITNGDKKEVIVLLEQMGQKIYIKLEQAEIDASLADAGTIEIKYLDDTKTIAGYACKKALCIKKDIDKSDTATVYYTEDLGGAALNYGDNQYGGLKGFPMEVTAKQGSIIITSTVTEVKKGKVKDTDFLIPADFTELTGEMKDQLKKMILGGGDEE